MLKRLIYCSKLKQKKRNGNGNFGLQGKSYQKFITYVILRELWNSKKQEWRYSNFFIKEALYTLYTLYTSFFIIKCI